MKAITKGKNILFINTSLFLNKEFSISIFSNMTQEIKIMNTKVNANKYSDNIFQISFDVVDLKKENLHEKKIYLDYGTHQILIKQDDIEYRDILYYPGDALKDDRKYKNEKVSRVYKKQ